MMAATRKAKRKAKAKRIGTAKPSLAKLKKRLWSLLSPAIKARYGASCYSCGAGGLSGSNHHTGHLFSAGGHSLTRFDPDNLRPQCYRCNVALRGNIAHYAARYIREHGLAAYEALAARSRVSHKWQRWEIEVLMEYLEAGFSNYVGYYSGFYDRSKA